MVFVLFFTQANASAVPLASALLSFNVDDDDDDDIDIDKSIDNADLEVDPETMERINGPSSDNDDNNEEAAANSNPSVNNSNDKVVTGEGETDFRRMSRTSFPPISHSRAASGDVAATAAAAALDDIDWGLNSSEDPLRQVG